MPITSEIVRLVGPRGEAVASIEVPPLSAMPQVIVWGSRTFRRANPSEMVLMTGVYGDHQTQREVYLEVDAYWVPDKFHTKEELQLRKGSDGRWRRVSSDSPVLNLPQDLIDELDKAASKGPEGVRESFVVVLNRYRPSETASWSIQPGPQLSINFLSQDG